MLNKKLWVMNPTLGLGLHLAQTQDTHCTQPGTAQKRVLRGVWECVHVFALFLRVGCSRKPEPMFGDACVGEQEGAWLSMRG